jgi:hypothetical protein
MRSDLPPLEISHDFTLEDIRKIREYDDLLFQSMTIDEQLAYYREASDWAHHRMWEIRHSNVKPIRPKRIPL